MSIPDHIIEIYMRCLTDIEDHIIQELKNGLNSNNINPMDYKKLLAHEIVKQFHTQNEANLSEKNFKESVQEKNVKFEKIKFEINKLNSKEKLSKMLFNKNIITSTSEFKRLIKQNGVKLNGKKPILMHIYLGNTVFFLQILRSLKNPTSRLMIF